MGTLSEFIDRISSASNSSNKKRFIANVKETKAYLDSVNEIRVIVCESRNFGHQSSTVNIMRNLIRMRVAKETFTLVLSSANLVDKIKTLIPQFQTLGTAFQLDGATVTVIVLHEQLNSGEFGITGGWDLDKDLPLQKLNVLNFVQLQPYGWEQGENLIYKKATLANPTKLSDVEGLYIKERAFYLPEPVITKSDWTSIKKTIYKEQAKIVRQIKGYMEKKKINLMPVYGISTISSTAQLSLFSFASGILQAQDDKVVNSDKPTVILVMQNLAPTGGESNQFLEDEYWFSLSNLITAGDGKYGSLDKDYLKGNQCFSEWHESHKVVNRISLLYKDVTDDAVLAAIGKLKSDQILIIKLGSIPTVLFNYLYKVATLPTVMEGQNTVELMLNLGATYFKITSNVEETDTGYPTLPLSNKTTGSRAKDCATISYTCTNLLSYPAYWRADKFPPTTAAVMVSNALNPESKASKISRYLKGLGNFYNAEQNDKLLLAMNYLVCVLKPQRTANVMALAADDFTVMAAGDQNTEKLAALYQSFETHIKEGLLDFYQGVGIEIFDDFFKNVVGSRFEITEAAPKINSEMTLVTLTGKTQAFDLGSTEVSFRFFMQGGDIAMTCTSSFSQVSWTLPGGQWLTLSAPTLEVTVSQTAPVPIICTLSTIISSGYKVKFSITMPIQPDHWLFDADIQGDGPSISDIFQLVGGINLKTILPPQIQLFSDIQVQNIGLDYNYKTNTADYVSLNMDTPQGGKWKLVPGVDITSLKLSTMVNEPGNLISRAFEYGICGQFNIGSSGKAEIYASLPDLTVSGGLLDDSPSVSVSEIITQYIGDGPAKLLPSFIQRVDISKLSFSLIQDLGLYTFDMQVDTDWTITILGKDLFTITNLGFDIQAQSTQLNNGGRGDENTEISGSFTGSTLILPETAKIGLTVTAGYVTDNGWTFSGQQTSGEVKLGDLLEKYLGWETDQKIGIDGLGITIETKTNSYEFTGKTAEPWEITPLNISFTASMKMGYKGGASTGAVVRMSKAEMPLLTQNNFPQAIELLSAEADVTGPYGEISAEIVWNNIDLLVAYNFAPESKSFEVTWGILTGKIEEKQVDGKKCQVATLKFTQSTTLGSMIEIMVSWATGSKFSLSAPWDLLDKINLSNFELVYNFTDETVQIKVNIGPIELGFATINSIGLSYEKSSESATEKSVMIDLDASFIFGGKIPKWDATKPETTPSPEGSGNKYFDLRMLAMGQHVTFDGFKDATSVQKAIELMAKMPEPKSDEIPAITFDADSSWLFAADFGVLKVGDTNNYTLTLQTIFNDPNLYALRIALDKDAPAAKIFKGLDFQIMYRKLTDSLGVYQSEITLPDAMRHLTVGAYSVTLPVFGIEIYTNGDFKIDIGFPWNEDFSRSFTVEAIVPPGIPLTGSGGLYFGKIPQVVANVPVTTKGHFNPILVLGFGAQVGLGKSIEYGILKAGFSLTVFGILEGLLAKWNPYLPSTGTGNSSDMQLQGEYYFNIQGTFGVIGKIYGSVDFAVVKADVNITIKIFAQITFASYQPIPISVVASVDATASISINLGLFSIHIHFSFSVRVKETFVIGALQNPNDAPWLDNNQGHNGRLSSPLSARLRDHAIALNMAEMTELKPDWSRLTAPAAPVPLEAYLAFAPTVAGDDAFVGTDTPDKSKQLPCYITSIFIKSVPAATENDNTSALKAETGRGDSSFEILAKMVARWGIASIQDSNVSPTSVDDLVVSDDSLKALLKYLEGTTEHPTPLPYADIETFITNQLQMTLSLPENGVSASSDNAAFFPMALPLTLDVPAYKDSTGKESIALNYRFDEYNTVDADFISWLREYFNQLAVQVQNEGGSGDGLTEMLLEGNASLAQFIFSDYFLLIMKQMLQAMRDGLRSFKYSIKLGDTGNGIVSWINTSGNLNGAFQLHDLFEGNANHKLNRKVGDKKQVLIIPGATYSVVAGDTFDTIAAKAQFNNYFTGKAMAIINGQQVDILKSGQTITYPGKDDYKIDGSVTLQTIADKVFAVSLDDLLDKSNILTSENLLVAFAPLALPNFNYTVQDGDTLNNIASKHGIDVRGLSITENGNITDIFDTADNEHLDLVHLPQFQVGELIKEAQRAKAIEHLSGMASRYYMHGLRLPTDKITPNKDGMWVKKNSAGVLSLPSDAGLFALTGQQFSIPALVADRPLTITLSRPKTLEWLIFNGGESSLAYTLKSEDSNYQSIQALHTYASQHALDTGLKNLGAESMVDSDSSNYPLSSSIPCQVAVSIDFPVGGETTGDGQPRLWYLPDAMQSLPPIEQGENDVFPDFELRVHRYNEATGTSDSHCIQNYGWATSVDFTIKRLPKVEGDSAYNDTYEIMGADGTAALLLERMAQIGSEDSISLLTLGYNVKSGSDSAFRIAMGAGITMGISQSNLSTTTRPPAMMFVEMEGLQPQPEQPTLLNTKLEFIQFLWKASITRNGGFYLYFNEQDQGGLPDTIFNDKGEASLSIFVLYSGNKGSLHSYMNAALIGDPVNISVGGIIAKAISSPLLYTTSDADSAEGIAKRHYSSILSLAQNNPEMVLSSGAICTLVNGTYQVPIGGSSPGGSLSSIASHFSMDAQAIKDVNPRVNWSTDLAIGTAIRLPQVSLTIGASPGGTTLQDIARYYGTSGAAILGANSLVTGLIGNGQNLTLAKGPFMQSGAEMPGVQAIGASRQTLPAIPAPTDPGYAKDYLLHLYTLLGYRVSQNQDFVGSKMGLPLGPKGESGSEGMDKIRFVKAMNEIGLMSYSKGIPYINLISAGNGHAEPVTNPYQANGRLLQMDYSWNDLYGNRLVTQLDERTLVDNKSPRAAVLTGYTDRLVGLSQWPGTSSHWTVAADTGDAEKFLLEVTISFDPSPYNKPVSGTSDSWQTRAHTALVTYEKLLIQLTDPSGIAVSFKTGLLAVLTSLTADQIGTLTSATSTLVGWLVAIKQFLKERAAGNSADIELARNLVLSTTAQKEELNSEQIFVIDFEFIIRRTHGVAEGDFAAMPSVRSIATAITPLTVTIKDGEAGEDSGKQGLGTFAKSIEDTLSDPEKFILTVGTGKDRSKADASGSKTAVWGIRLSEKPEQGIYFSVNEYDPKSKKGAPQIFAPRPVLNQLKSEIVNVYPYSSPKDFDPTSNNFTTTPAQLNFIDIDLDNWVRQFFTSIDDLLSPQYLSSMLLIDRAATEFPSGIASFTESFNDQKQKLARVAEKLMSAVYKTQESSLIGSAQEALYQKLLEKLSNLYSTRAAVSFSADVVADPNMSEPYKNPQLYGNVVFINPSAHNKQVVLTSPKLELATNEKAPLTFLLEVPALSNSKEGGVSSSLALDLKFNGAAIEHQITEIPGVENYMASTWLGLVRAETTDKLQANLGSFEVPMFIRGFPATPRMVLQAGTPFKNNVGQMSLADLTAWDYSFTYSQDYHYPQDRVYGQIDYNLRVRPEAALFSSFPDAFNALAQFITAKPELEKLLKEKVSQVSARTVDLAKINDAAKVLGAFLKMITDVSDRTSEGAGFVFKQSLSRLTGDAQLTYKFYIEEKSYTFKPDESSDDITAWVVKVVSSSSLPPVGLLPQQHPFVNVPGDDIIRNVIPDNNQQVGTDFAKGIYAFWYSRDSKPLTGSDVQIIKDRKVTMPGLNILQREDARSTVYLKRNEELVSGNPSADEFIYQTPTISFTNSLVPTIDHSHPFDISTIPSSIEAETLAAYLSNFFEALFGDDTQSIQLECQYSYMLSEAVGQITLPVLMLPPISVNPKSDFNVLFAGDPGFGQTETFVYKLSNRILKWFNLNNPTIKNGVFNFDLTVMSHLTEHSMPLIRLRSLYLDVDKISELNEQAID